jgi:hypothetical protein
MRRINAGKQAGRIKQVVFVMAEKQQEKST